MKSCSIATFILCIYLVNSYYQRGEPGTKGDKGERGPPGPPGICHCPTSPSPSPHNSYKQPQPISLNQQIAPKHNKPEKIHSGSIHSGAAAHSEQNIGGDLHLNTDYESDTDITTDERRAANLKAFNDLHGSKQEYAKGDFNINNGYSGYNKEGFQEKEVFNSSDVTLQDVLIDYNKDVKTRYRESVGDEGHSGKYTGTEFDVSQKLRDNQGGFYDNTANNEIQASKYAQSDTKGEKFKKGKYYADEYNKNGDEDKDEKYRAISDIGHGNERDLFSAYKGTEDKNGGYNDYGKPDNNALHGYRREDYDSSKDKDYRAYGQTFDGNDKYGDNQHYDIAYGNQNKQKLNGEFNKGKYRDVDNKGSNKLAEYQGDYNTRDKFKDVDNTVDYHEELHQVDAFDGGLNGLDFDDGNPDVDWSVVERKQKKETYNEGEFNAFNNFDNKNEREYNNKRHDDKYKERYDTHDQQREREYDNDAKLRYDRNQYNGNNANKKRNYDRGYNNNNNNNKYYRRRMINFETNDREITELRNQINRLSIGFMVMFGAFFAQNAYLGYFLKRNKH